MLLTSTVKTNWINKFDDMRREYIEYSYEHWIFAWDSPEVGFALIGSNGEEKGIILDVNPTFAKHLGYGVTEMVGQNIVNFNHPEDAYTAMNEMQEVIDGNLPYIEQDKRYLSKLGKEVRAHLRSGPVRDDNGSILHFASEIIFYSEDVADLAKLAAVESRLDMVMGAVMGMEKKSEIHNHNHMGANQEVSGSHNQASMGGGFDIKTVAIIGSIVMGFLVALMFLAQLIYWPMHQGEADLPNLPSIEQDDEPKNRPVQD